MNIPLRGKDLEERNHSPRSETPWFSLGAGPQRAFRVGNDTTFCQSSENEGSLIPLQGEVGIRLVLMHLARHLVDTYPGRQLQVASVATMTWALSQGA